MVETAVIIGVTKLILMFLIIATLFFASLIDLKYTRIDLKTVIILFVLVPIYLVVADANMVMASFTFMFSLACFLGLWIVSKGGFGLGDVMVLSALGWLMADFMLLQAFMVTLGVFSIPWACFWLWRYHRDPNKKEIWSGLAKKVIPVDRLRPGMVLAKDRFMRGLTEREIDKMRHNGFLTVDVKQPMPFIPVVFAVSFLYAVAPSLLLSF